MDLEERHITTRVSQRAKGLSVPSTLPAKGGSANRPTSPEDDVSCIGVAFHSYTGFGPGQTFVEIMNGMSRDGMNARALLPRLRAHPGDGAQFRATLPMPLRLMAWRYVRDRGKKSAERMLLNMLDRADPAHTAVFTFPDMTLDTARAIRARGFTLVREMTNLHRGTARRIIVEEHQAEGLPAFVEITPESVAEETEWLDLATHIIAPNPHVATSLIDHGVAAARIRDSAYGWSRERFVQAAGIRAKRAPGQRAALFAGRVSYQKGAHLLLRAWHRAGCPGTLLLAGTIEPELEQRLGDLLDHPSIEKLGFLKQVEDGYLRADYFVFPSLVEGGPQVTYEAAAHGLPVIVSPMGAGRLAEGDLAGRIVDPHDCDAMAALIADFAGRDDLDALGAAAQHWAQAFEWQALAAERADIIRQAVIATR